MGFARNSRAIGLARESPDTPIVLDHTGMSVDCAAAEIEAWKKAMKLFATEPNVSCKISGAGVGDWKWTVDSTRPYALRAIEAFGVERCMFASNFPVDKLG